MRVKHMPSAADIRQQGRITLNFSRPYTITRPMRRTFDPDDHEMWRLARALQFGLIDDHTEPPRPARARIEVNDG